VLFKHLTCAREVEGETTSK